MLSEQFKGTAYTTDYPDQATFDEEAGSKLQLKKGFGQFRDMRSASRSPH